MTANVLKRSIFEYKKGKAGGKKRGEPNLGKRGRGNWVGPWADGGGGRCLGPVGELAALVGLGGVHDLDGLELRLSLGVSATNTAPCAWRILGSWSTASSQ